jgi:hypothetical protein
MEKTYIQFVESQQNLQELKQENRGDFDWQKILGALEDAATAFSSSAPRSGMAYLRDHKDNIDDMKDLMNDAAKHDSGLKAFSKKVTAANKELEKQMVAFGKAAEKAYQKELKAWNAYKKTKNRK